MYLIKIFDHRSIFDRDPKNDRSKLWYDRDRDLDRSAISKADLKSKKSIFLDTLAAHTQQNIPPALIVNLQSGILKYRLLKS